MAVSGSGFIFSGFYFLLAGLFFFFLRGWWIVSLTVVLGDFFNLAAVTNLPVTLDRQIT